MHQPLASNSKALQSWHALEIQLQNYLKQIGNKQKILFPHINIEISETITFLTIQIKNSKTWQIASRLKNEAIKIFKFT